METLNTPLTQNLIADNLDFQTGFVQFNYDNNKNTPVGQQMLQELNMLKALSLEEKHNTDLFSKISEVFEEDYKNNSLYEEDGKTFTNKSIEKALDLYSDYKINEFIETTISDNIIKANDLIQEGLKTKNDIVLEDAKRLLNPNGIFQREYQPYSEFKELCIKSRLNPSDLLNHMSSGSFADFESFSKNHIPSARASRLNTIHSIEVHHKNNIAIGEALNTPNHLINKKMETKQETKTISGHIGSISEEKGTDKKYVDVSIAINKPGEKATFQDVRVWADAKGENTPKKVGDFISVEGYEKTLKNSKEEDYTVFNVTAIKEHKATERLKLTGNLGSDPEFKEVSGKQVATVSIAVKGADNVTEWKRIQMWEDKAEIAKGLKKGDTITVEGKEGKEYSYQKAGETLTTKDVIASVVEKHEKKSKEELNKDLITYAQKGDWEKVSDSLKKGADSKIVTEDHLKDLSPKQQDAIKNTIRTHEDFAAKNAEKKNSGMKM